MKTLFGKNRAFKKAVRNPIDLVEHLTPTNYHDEKVAWLRSRDKSYNPKFTYHEADLHNTLTCMGQLLDNIEAILPTFKNDPPGNIARDQLTGQYLTLRHSCSLLKKILDNLAGQCQLDFASTKEDINVIFSLPTDHELSLAKMMHEVPIETVVFDHLLDDNDGTYSHEALDEVISDFLFDFDGILTDDEREKLEVARFGVGDVASFFYKTFPYACFNADVKAPLIKITPDTVWQRFAIFPNTKGNVLWILLPINVDLNGLEVLDAVSHELAHYRAVVSSVALSKQLLGPYFQPRIIHTDAHTITDEGFASLYATRAVGAEGLNSPYYVIAADYASQGHNFSETSRYLYDLFDIEPRSDLNFDEKIWNAMQLFYGQTDTSSHGGFITPKESTYLLGQLRVLRALSRKPVAKVKPLEFMRFSNLPLSTIDDLMNLSLENPELALPDPFAVWNYTKTSFVVEEPIQFLKHLLLEHIP